MDVYSSSEALWMLFERTCEVNVATTHMLFGKAINPGRYSLT